MRLCDIITLQFLSWYRDAGKIEANQRESYLGLSAIGAPVFMGFCANLADRQDFFVVGVNHDTENENHG